ncbi:preprotein translocase subunit SecA [Oligosphaera ethanolica]|uniref:Protein translocase subunit SecA n=1 Tax=Oligosphaera ethanolica TaxID=760260 RepID=A0AAE3VG71_9BACT|nr:preprotein translocase subunit SecA [Oligosphaera ethanolica]MDQ0290002.1 preprotein translocase subunit SecA [Oligosphaera ethanolica]
MKKLFGSRNARVLKRMQPLVDRINGHFASYSSLSDVELQAKTQEFRERLQKGETLDDILCEAYAVVKDACRRLLGTKVEVTGHVLSWDMVPFDVQLVGAIALHQNNIAEMATGEGKTLVAVMPLYLNALSGRNVQLVTVNDYLARRDSDWMGHVLKWLGLTVGCIQNEMTPAQRREQYACDVTYGTNSEFGFDYLRDMGMAMSRDEMVQRDHFYAIVDEIDSILIDEARTPLIIAGPAKVSTHMFDKLKPSVSTLFRQQSKLLNDLMSEARDILAKEDASPEEKDHAYLLLAKVQLGMPKHKQLMRLMEEPAIRKALDKKDAEMHSDNNRGFLQEVKETLYFSIDEKGQEAELSEKGRQFLRPGETDAFVIPDLPTIFSDIDSDNSLDDNAKLEKRKQAQAEYDNKAEIIHNISQLLRAFCLFEKDVQYVVQDNKVIIVDEFTGRPQPGRRFSEGLHQALEAKEDVQIERETQTLASITIQNYFRMYDKLAGMTGTAETEANEFKAIYNLDVVVVPTNRPCMRKDSDDRIYKTQREKYKAIIEEIADCNKRGQPVLVGTISVEVSELLSRMLQRRNIVHNVLNAKHHESEAEIVARAGQLSAVTIATNMAGRGTDIKLGAGVKEAGGLHVIGSERHDSRRIDRQLRGRCARQGDPGSSRFYISLEDNLMRLFGSDRVASIMEKMGLQEGEELSHSLLNRSIEGAQRRVEQQHFAIRKRTLEYDDVMNKQRVTIYGLRKSILLADDPRELLMDFIYTAISEKIDEAYAVRIKNEAVDFSVVREWLARTFPIGFGADLFDSSRGQESIAKGIMARIEDAYAIKVRMENPDALHWLERYIMLSAMDGVYQEHLYAMDALRQGVQLRSYGQRDPLVEYKQEAYEMFSRLMDTVKDDICANVFRLSTIAIGPAKPKPQTDIQEVHEGFNPFEGAGSGGATETAEPQRAAITVRRAQPKVGRNDPCPCGSGKKYKACCGR